MSTVQPIREKQMIRDIINYLKQKNERDYIMFLMGIYTGLRISDILNLKVRDVKNKKGITIIEQKTKNKKNGNKRQIIFHKELKSALDKYTREMDQYEFLIKSREGYNKPISRTQAYRILQEVAERFELDCIGTHTLRKTYGFHMYMTSNKDVVLVQKALNHSHPTITLRYIGVDQDRVFNTNLNLQYY